MEQAEGSSQAFTNLEAKRVPGTLGVSTLAFSLLPLTSQTLLEQRSGGSGKGCNKVRPGQRVGGREEELPKGPSDLIIMSSAVLGNAGCDGGTTHYQHYSQIHLPGSEAGADSE